MRKFHNSSDDKTYLWISTEMSLTWHYSYIVKQDLLSKVLTLRTENIMAYVEESFNLLTRRDGTARVVI